MPAQWPDGPYTGTSRRLFEYRVTHVRGWGLAGHRDGVRGGGGRRVRPGRARAGAWAGLVLVLGGCLAGVSGALRAPPGAAGSRGCGGLPVPAFPCRTGSVKCGFHLMGSGRLRRLRAGVGGAHFSPNPDRRAGLTCPGAAGRAGRGGGWRVPGLDVDLASAENGSAGAGRCFVRPWVTAVTPLRVDND